MRIDLNMSDDTFRIKKRKSSAKPACDEVLSPQNVEFTTKWNEELHRYFVKAIYDAGVSQSSPSVVIENMSSRPASLTSERVKSHLQKYRKNKEKSRDEFMQDYDSFMRKSLTIGGARGGLSHSIMPPAAMIEMLGGGKRSGGDIAAFISYSVMTEGEITSTSGSAISSCGIAKESQDYIEDFAGTHVSFPQLTEEEKRSPLGISMVYTMGLFSSLSQHIMHERRKKCKRGHLADDQLPSSSQNCITTFSITASDVETGYIKASRNTTLSTVKPRITAPAHLFVQPQPAAALEELSVRLLTGSPGLQRKPTPK